MLRIKAPCDYVRTVRAHDSDWLQQGGSTGDVDILLHSPHSHMEAIKHHYLNIDIEQRRYLVFRKHSNDNWQVMAWLVLVATVCLAFSTSKLQFVMKVKFHTGQAFQISLPRPNTHPSPQPSPFEHT